MSGSGAEAGSIPPTTDRIAVIGGGILGARIARELLTPTASGGRAIGGVVIASRRADRVDTLRSSFGSSAEVVRLHDRGSGLDAGVRTVVVARLAGDQLPVVEEHLRAGRHVVTTSDDPVEVRQLLALGDRAAAAGTTLVVGAAMAPGLSCLLVRHAAELLDHVDEVHVSRHGAAGPGCARQRLRALRGTATEWRDGEWVKRPGFSGRELAWFPDPIGARDCYRAALADPLVLVPALPGVSRVTARLAANRRDRTLAPFPVLWPPPVEGGLGAVRVELRGDRDGARETVVYGVLDRPAIAAAATAAVTALHVASGAAPAGAMGLAGIGSTRLLLGELARRGVRAAVFEGAHAAPLQVIGSPVEQLGGENR